EIRARCATSTRRWATSRAGGSRAGRSRCSPRTVSWRRGSASPCGTSSAPATAGSPCDWWSDASNDAGPGADRLTECAEWDMLAGAHRRPETQHRSVTMPIYEYACKGCGNEFEMLIRGQKTPVCPACESEDLERLLSLP